MKTLTLEKSTKAAIPLKRMMDIAKKLDIEYLTAALDDMKKNQSFRDSAMVLNPNPFTAIEKQELNAAKIKQLELIIKLAKNTIIIRDAEMKLLKAKGNENKLNNIFGF